jgi:hypothetical protein
MMVFTANCKTISDVLHLNAKWPHRPVSGLASIIREVVACLVSMPSYEVGKGDMDVAGIQTIMHYDHWHVRFPHAGITVRVPLMLIQSLTS